MIAAEEPSKKKEKTDMMHMKRIPLEGAYNFRDLGGYPAADGACTRWGMLYRSDSLAALTAAGWQTLRRLQVKTIVDLRSSFETASAPIRPPEGITYKRFSLMSELDALKRGIAGANNIAGIIAKSMQLDYGRTVFGNIPCCVDILHTITERMQAGSVVFLCSAGKDRTGITAALVLYLCGAPREDIIADYMVSSTYNTNGINKKMTSFPDFILKMIPDRSLLKSVMESKPETMTALLDELDAQDIRRVLAEGGFSTECQQLLKERFTVGIVN